MSEAEANLVSWCVLLDESDGEAPCWPQIEQWTRAVRKERREP